MGVLKRPHTRDFFSSSAHNGKMSLLINNNALLKSSPKDVCFFFAIMIRTERGGKKLHSTIFSV